MNKENVFSGHNFKQVRCFNENKDKSGKQCK